MAIEQFKRSPLPRGPAPRVFGAPKRRPVVVGAMQRMGESGLVVPTPALPGSGSKVRAARSWAQSQPACASPLLSLNTLARRTTGLPRRTREAACPDGDEALGGEPPPATRPHQKHMRRDAYARSSRTFSTCSGVAWTAGSKILVEMGSPFRLTATLIAETNRSHAS